MSDKNASVNEGQAKRLVPKLRFPEFRDGEVWDQRRLRDVLSISATYGIVKAGDFQQDGVPMLRGGDIKGGRIGDGVPLVASEVHLQYKRTILQYNDVVISLVGYPGEAAVIPRHYIGANISRAVGLLRPHKLLSPFYLASYLNSPVGRSTVLKPSAGSAQVVVNLEHLNALVIPMPEMVEQEKISDCICSLDAWVDAETRKLDALRAHKQGLMRQLFPGEGERVPRLRFTGFAEEWSGQKLTDVSSVVRGGSPRPIDSFITDAGNGLNWLKIGDVEKESKYIERTTEKVIPAALTKTRQINSGDLILSNSMSFGRPYISRITACIHDGWLAITEIQERIDPEFLYYFLGSDLSQSYFHTLAAGSGVKNLNVESIKLLPLTFPGKAEQKKIANCLSFIDDLIAAYAAKIKLLVRHKKGLMQGLFPPVIDGRCA